MTRDRRPDQSRYFIRLASITVFILFTSIATRDAQAIDVDLELLLAVDVSTSVDPVEARQQRSGYVAALREPALQQAIQDGPYGRIALRYVEWAGESYQRIIVDWTVIDSVESAEAFARTLEGSPISSAPSTSISGLIDFARDAFQANEYEGLRQVIDISGDGPNSAGRSAAIARDEAVASGITINGLPVLSSRPDPGAGAPATGVERHYRRYVIGGPGAFLLNVAEFENFAPIVLKKLIREIRGTVPSAQLVPDLPDQARHQSRSHSGEKSKSQMR